VHDLIPYVFPGRFILRSQFLALHEAMQKVPHAPVAYESNAVQNGDASEANKEPIDVEARVNI
jgi:hypothetical protein